jgi:hypothetical protein
VIPGRGKLRWLGVLVLLYGCQNNPDLRPSKQPESYALPPLSEPRFSQPPVYPRDKWEEDPLKARQQQEEGPPGGPGRPGLGGPGAARPY